MSRDLCLLLFYILPDPSRSLRLYWLLFLRLVLYCCEGLIVYSLTATIIAGESAQDPGILVELTRMILCHATEQSTSKRTRRSADTWQNFLSNVNETHPELAEIWDELIWPAKNVSDEFISTSEGFNSSTEDSNNSTEKSLFTSSTEVSNNSTEGPLFNSNLTTMSSPMTTHLTTLFNSNLTTMSSPMTTHLTTLTNSNTLSSFPTQAMDFLSPKTTMRGYRLGLCLEVNGLESNSSTLVCTSVLGPVCLLLVILMFAIAVGYTCGRAGQRERVAEKRGRAAGGEDERCATGTSPQFQEQSRTDWM